MAAVQGLDADGSAAGTATGSPVMLSARGLRKEFGGFVAVNNVDLDVHHARVHALIGPNGAGKTTVFNLLTKFLQPTAGSIRLLDHDITRTDPAKVAFQMDVLWVQFPGEDPAAWLLKYPGRWHLMHLKDLKKGVATGIHTGGTDPNNDVVLGTGQMDWPRILQAARRSGVRHYFIEDESAASESQIPQSLDFLSGVRF